MFTNAVVILWYLNLLQNSVWSLFTNNCGHEWSNIKTKALSTTVSFYVWFILLHRVLITHDLYFNMVSSLKRERVSFMLVCQKDFLNIIIVSYIVNFPNSFTSTCSLHPSYLTPNIFRITHTHTLHMAQNYTHLHSLRHILHMAQNYQVCQFASSWYKNTFFLEVLLSIA